MASCPTPTSAAFPRSVVGFVMMNERDALRPALRVGHGGHDEDLADATVRDESLRSVDDVIVILPHRRRARATGVATRAFLSQAEAAKHATRSRGAERNARFCSSVPKCTIGDVPSVVWAEMVIA